MPAARGRMEIIMKVLIIGGVAAGTKAAAKLKRRNPDTDVTIITKSKEISYAWVLGCIIMLEELLKAVMSLL